MPARCAEEKPHGQGTFLIWCPVDDVIAFATEAVLYEKMTGDPAYR